MGAIVPPVGVNRENSSDMYSLIPYFSWCWKRIPLVASSVVEVSRKYRLIALAIWGLGDLYTPLNDWILEKV